MSTAPKIAIYTYLGEDTKPGDGTSPANLKVNTVGDELRYATGKQSKVITISGKDRGAILLAEPNRHCLHDDEKTGNLCQQHLPCKAILLGVSTRLRQTAGQILWPTLELAAR